jgi:hypothetical protein
MVHTFESFTGAGVPSLAVSGKDLHAFLRAIVPMVPVPHANRPRIREYQSHFCSSVSTAALEIFGRLDQNLDSSWFVSVPVRIEGHIITFAPSLNRDVVIGYSGTGASDAPSYDITHSLLNAVIFEFLNACYASLLEPDPGSRLTLYSREHSKLVRSAENQLMFKLTYRTRQWGYPVSLFDACNAISALRYEGEPGIGTMVIAERERVEIDVVVELLSRVALTDHRGTRKLLEIATEQMCLLSDAGYIYGLGRCGQADSEEEDGIVRVDFTGHYAWEVSCNGHPLMRVINGHPQIPGKAINEREYPRMV